MIVAANPPINLPLERLTREQKQEVRDWLDADLAKSEPPAWHFEVLEEREARLKSGEATLLEVDDFITEMRRRMP